jgi:hypothetical protein
LINIFPKNYFHINLFPEGYFPFTEDADVLSVHVTGFTLFLSVSSVEISMVNIIPIPTTYVDNISVGGGGFSIAPYKFKSDEKEKEKVHEVYVSGFTLGIKLGLVKVITDVSDEEIELTLLLSTTNFNKETDEEIIALINNVLNALDKQEEEEEIVRMINLVA